MNMAKYTAKLFFFFLLLTYILTLFKYFLTILRKYFTLSIYFQEKLVDEPVESPNNQDIDTTPVQDKSEAITVSSSNKGPITEPVPKTLETDLDLEIIELPNSRVKDSDDMVVSDVMESEEETPTAELPPDTFVVNEARSSSNEQLGKYCLNTVVYCLGYLLL